MSREQRYIDSIWHAAEDRMQEIAQAELESCHPRFVDWLCDCHDISEFAAMISTACVVEGSFACDHPAWDNLRAHADRLREDYWRFRMTCSDMDDLYADAESDEAEAHQSRMEDVAEERGFEGIGR